MCQSQEDVPGFPETITNDSCHCSHVHPSSTHTILHSRPTRPKASHLSNPPVKVYRDTGDTRDTRKCVSVALGNWTLRGLTSLASRDAVEEASPLAIVAVVVLRPYATTDR